MSGTRVSLPHMGNYYIAFKALIEGMGFETVTPPPITRRTIELGSAHSPEFTCLPFKINLGNYIEVLEKGAEVLLQAGRAGDCRYGLYGEVQEQILRDLGFRFKMVNLFSGGKKFNFASALRQIDSDVRMLKLPAAALHTLARINLIDEVERRARKLRAYEAEKGAVGTLLDRALKQVDSSKSAADAVRTGKRILAEFDAVRIKTGFKALRIGIVGELYVVMEPRSNLDIEKKLGEMGVEITRPMCLGALLRDAVLPFRRRRVIAEGSEFIIGELGAHAADSVGHTVEFAREGLDGVIHLYPFTCMPEISARSILSNVSRKLGIPVLSLSFSEQTGEAGLDTRLESFVDMIERRKKKK